MDIREKASIKKRLIDANELIKEANADGAYGYVDAKQIADAPTVDAVEVVRCRECKKKNKKKCPMTIVNFGRNGKEVLVQNHVPDDFYCAAGERKEGAD